MTSAKKKAAGAPAATTKGTNETTEHNPSIPQHDAVCQVSVFRPLAADLLPSADSYHDLARKYPERAAHYTETARLVENWQEPLNDGEQFMHLLAHLWRGGAYGHYWTKSGTDWRELRRQDTSPRTPKTNYYYGVHPTRGIPELNCQGKRAPAQHVRSQISKIAAVNCLFAEFDDKDYPGRGALLRHVYSLRPEPSALIDSGGGVHCYWLLRDTFKILGEGDQRRAKRLQAAWVDFVGGDPGAKDLARVLRVPGSLNYKYNPPRPVTFLQCRMDRLYTVEQLEAVLPEETQPQPTKEARRRKSKPAWAPNLERVQGALNRLATWRADQYTTWIQIGMALSELGQDGFGLWADWSRQSVKFADPGNDDLMVKKWATFTPADGLTLGSLFFWAEQDNPKPVVELMRSIPEPEPPEHLPARVNICGLRAVHTNPDTGWLKHKIWACGETRHCDYCAEKKARELRARVARAMAEGPVYLATLDVAEGKRLMRKAGKKNSLRIESQGDTVWFFDTIGAGDPLTLDTLPGIETFTNLVKSIPEGRRTSGHLGKTPTEAKTSTPAQDDKEEGVPVLVKMIVHNAPDEVEQRCFETAKRFILSRLHAFNATQSNGEKLMDDITTEFKRELRRNGYEITRQITQEVECDLTRLSQWVNDALNDIGDQNEPSRAPEGGPSHNLSLDANFPLERHLAENGQMVK